MRPGIASWYRRPEILLADLLMRSARNELDPERNLLRARVLAVDPEGGHLENPTGSGVVTGIGTDDRRRDFQATVGPVSPVGAVRARILTQGIDRLRGDGEVRVFWPLHPQDQLSIPISPGEHVYVMFEDVDMEHGLWISRVSGHESAGVFPGTDSYTAPSAARSAMDSFEENSPQYPRDDAAASLAPAKDSMGLFEKED